MKVNRRTNLTILVALLMLCQVSFNSARPNSLRGSRRNSVHKTNKAKRGWNQESSSTDFDDARPTRISDGADDVAVDTNTEDKKPSEGGDTLGSKMFLELDGIPPSRVSVKVHGDLTLECQAIGSPPPIIYWLRNGRPIQHVAPFDTDEYSNRVESRIPIAADKQGNFAMSKVKSKLPLRCIHAEEEAEYSCVADNSGRQLVASTLVTVEEDGLMEARPECEYRASMFSYSKKGKRGQPAFIMSSETFHMEAMGNDIILPCRGSGRPRPLVVWIDADGQRIASGKKFLVSPHGDLVIRNLSWSEMGDYTCLVENPFGSDASSTFLYPLLAEDS